MWTCSQSTPPPPPARILLRLRCDAVFSGRAAALPPPPPPPPKKVSTGPTRAGFEELCRLDSRFEAYSKSLLSRAASALNRELQVPATSQFIFIAIPTAPRRATQRAAPRRRRRR